MVDDARTKPMTKIEENIARSRRITNTSRVNDNARLKHDALRA